MARLTVPALGGALAIALIGALAPIPLASAHTYTYPSPADRTVRVPRAIAGVRIGQRLEDARRAWGPGRGHCEVKPEGFAVCTYGNDREEGRGVAYFAADGSRPGSRVYLATIAVGLRLGVVPVYKGPLMSLRTPKGVGLGSKVARLRRAYPRVRADSLGFHLRRHRVEIDFETFNSLDDHTITTISIERIGAFG